MGPRWAPPSACGSYHNEDSIGSSVNATNNDTSTANATVMPNGKKNRPTIPFMNATGTNTAITDSVVDQDPDSQRQGHQRHDVDREAECVDREKGGDHRHGQREPSDHRGAPRVEEQEDDEYGEERAFNQCLLDVVHGIANPGRVVLDRRQRHAVRDI